MKNVSNLGTLNVGVTGATGFVGKTLIRHLHDLDTQDNLFILGRKPVDSNANFIYFDLMEETSSTKIPKLDCLVHIASYIPDNQTSRDILPAELVNGKGMVRLLELLDKSSLKKVINISSCHIWNPGEPDIINNPYEGSKLSGETFLNAYAKFYGFEALNLRLGYVYGPSMNHGRMFKTFIEKALNDEPIHLFNRGEDEVHLIFVEDVAEAISEALRSNLNSGTFDICNKMPTSTAEVVETILNFTNSNSNVTVDEDSRPSITFELNPDLTKEKLGFSPKTTVAEGIKRILKEEYQVA